MFCAWLPPSLYLRDPRAQVSETARIGAAAGHSEKVVGNAATTLPAGSPLAGTTPLPTVHNVSYDCCMPIPLPLPSCCFLFLLPSSLVLPYMLHLRFLFLCFLALSSLHHVTAVNILMKMILLCMVRQPLV